jgi:hypothetical protein
MSDLMKVGSDFGATGTFKPLTATTSGAQRVADAHGRFFDASFSGRLFAGGAGLTAINNATFTIATLGNTATPIIGLWNPSSSNVNASILQATLATIMTALQATGPGGYQWAVSTNNPALTLGSLGFNRKTLTQAGGYCKVLAGVALTGLTNNPALTLGSLGFNRKTLTQAGGYCKVLAGVALTGLTNNLVAMCGSALGGGSSYNAALLGTAAGFQTQQVTSVENLDGSIIVPPGGIIALLATTTPVAHSVVPGLLWEELPLYF